MNGANALDKLPITIETNTRSSWEVVENLIRREHRLKGLKIAVVDYIQQFHIRNKKMNSRAEELTEIADRAKAIALELEITVIMVAQLNRGAEENEDYKPKMSHLKDSGGLEQAADFIGFLHSANAEYKISLSVVKNRLGISGTMHLRVDLSTNKFHRE
jgi:replicative DNA helicase